MTESIEVKTNNNVDPEVRVTTEKGMFSNEKELLDEWAKDNLTRRIAAGAIKPFLSLGETQSRAALGLNEKIEQVNQPNPEDQDK